VAPSTELRRWYGHQLERYAEFTERYRAELTTEAGVAALRELVGLSVAPYVLVTATKDLRHSHLPALAEVLTEEASAETGLDGEGDQGGVGADGHVLIQRLRGDRGNVRPDVTRRTSVRRLLVSDWATDVRGR
jgi:hypothetical protein